MWSAMTIVLCPETRWSLAWHAHQRAYHATAESTSGLSQIGDDKKIMEISLSSNRLGKAGWLQALAEQVQMVSHHQPHSPRAGGGQS